MYVHNCSTYIVAGVDVYFRGTLGSSSNLLLFANSGAKKGKSEITYTQVCFLFTKQEIQS